LRERDHWVVWRREPCYDRSTKKRRWTKVPYRADGRGRASSTDPSTWSSFARAFGAHNTRNFDGVGYVLAADAPFVGIDLDHAIDDAVVTAPWAAEIIAALNSYAELSPSRRGYRIFVSATLPTGGNRRGDVEMYDRARFVTVTGWHVSGMPRTIERRDAELAAIHARFIASPQPSTVVATVTPVRHVSLDDHDLLTRAMQAANGVKFARLWNGDVSGYGGDDSAADLALCSFLAFWTGGDPHRIDRLFRASGLIRGKWDERRGAQTYGERTIARALQ
jgi:primase-polymerase (primpol)-like protein